MTINNDLKMEMQDSPFMKKIIEGAMLSDFTKNDKHTVPLTLSVTNGTLTRSSGSFVDEVKAGDFIKLDGYKTRENNVVVFVSGVNTTVLNIIIPQSNLHQNMSGEAGSANTTYQILDKIGRGRGHERFSVEKSDSTTEGTPSTDMLVNSLDFNVDREETTCNADFVEAEEPTTQIYDGSDDLILVATKVSTDWRTSDSELERIGITINNNFQPDNVLGQSSPVSYHLGDAKIDVNLEFNDLNLPSGYQATISLAFMLSNSNASYGFYLPAIQFPLDSSLFQQNGNINITGKAIKRKKDESALTIYRYSPIG